MANKGPVPKRTEERLGHMTKAQKAGVSKVQVSGVVEVPPLPADAHHAARRWYEALKESGQTVYFEPSDWAAALYVAEAMSRNLSADRFSAQMFSAVWSAMDDLLTTESARRRARVEVIRALEGDNPDAPTPLDEYRKATQK